jgi:hypothetical protein
LAEGTGLIAGVQEEGTRTGTCKHQTGLTGLDVVMEDQVADRGGSGRVKKSQHNKRQY